MEIFMGFRQKYTISLGLRKKNNPLDKKFMSKIHSWLGIWAKIWSPGVCDISAKSGPIATKQKANILIDL